MSPIRLVTHCGSLVVHDHYGLDGVRRIPCQPGLDIGGIGAVAPVTRHEIDLDAPARRHLPPQRREMAGLNHQHLVARRQRIDDRRLPGAGSRRWKNDHRSGRLKDLLAAIEYRFAELGEFGAAMVHDRHVHGAKHPIRHRAWTGNLQKWRPWCSLMDSLVSSSLVQSYCIQNIRDQPNKCLQFFSTTIRSIPMLALMKPLIPNAATSTAVGAGADPGREELSLHDEILARLRDHIVEGNIPGGARVPERQLCAMLGISRTPLREALKVLASEGLVELLPNRGARVRQLSEHELGELFDVMGGLEGLAGRLACENITDAEIAEVERLHYEMYGFYLHRDMHGYFRVNQLIHQRIVEAARNAVLLGTYSSFAGRIRRIRYSANFARKRERWGEAMREHEAILDALRRRAGSELSDILFEHLRNKRTAAVEHLRADDPLPSEPD
jgi:DNA-binding GntR family transcriptional regulator